MIGQEALAPVGKLQPFRSLLQQLFDPHFLLFTYLDYQYKIVLYHKLCESLEERAKEKGRKEAFAASRSILSPSQGGRFPIVSRDSATSFAI